MNTVTVAVLVAMITVAAWRLFRPILKLLGLVLLIGALLGALVISQGRSDQPSTNNPSCPVPALCDLLTNTTP